MNNFNFGTKEELVDFLYLFPENGKFLTTNSKLCPLACWYVYRQPTTNVRILNASVFVENSEGKAKIWTYLNKKPGEVYDSPTKKPHDILLGDLFIAPDWIQRLLKKINKFPTSHITPEQVRKLL